MCNFLKIFSLKWLNYERGKKVSCRRWLYGHENAPRFKKTRYINDEDEGWDEDDDDDDEDEDEKYEEDEDEDGDGDNENEKYEEDEKEDDIVYF
jgi:hypothetical protein